MDAFEVLLAAALLAAAFCLGWLSVFAGQVKLALRKDLFVCARCGNCCRLRFIALSPEDIKRITAKGHGNFYDKTGNEFRLKRNKGKCVFLNDDKCSIYEVRPEVCRSFPFFSKFGLTYCRAVSYCPGVEELRKNA